MKQIVQVGDMKVGVKGDEIVTHALGSCLGLMVYDPVAHVGGLLHAMLPLSKINPQKAEANPYMFVDKGVPCLFKEVYGLGGEKERLIVKAAGCGSPIGKNEMFKIGERNYTVLKKLKDDKIRFDELREKAEIAVSNEDHFKGIAFIDM